MQNLMLEEILILVAISLLNLKISRCRMHECSEWGQEARVGGSEACGFPNSVFSLQNAKSQKILMSQTAAKVEQLCKSWARKSADFRLSVCYSVVRKRRVG